ncbi:MAG: cupin domain-containing protein [Thermanaerothrix sp.]|nr:cupin domain-containing protein [Thermanaerothrix sp.]
MIGKENAEHYEWGQHCDGWYLVKSLPFTVIQERMPPHTAETRHWHTVSHQFFYILSGQATMEINGDICLLHAQQGVEVPPQMPHQMMNTSDADLEFIVISCPPSHGDRVNFLTPPKSRGAEGEFPPP